LREKCSAAIFVLQIFQNFRKPTEFYWIFGYVMKQNIAEYKEELHGKCNIIFNGCYWNYYYVNIHMHVSDAGMRI
jgi:hypothetical protein